MNNSVNIIVFDLEKDYTNSSILNPFPWKGLNNPHFFVIKNKVQATITNL